jgi:hypothetical protein
MHCTLQVGSVGRPMPLPTLLALAEGVDLPTGISPPRSRDSGGGAGVGLGVGPAPPPHSLSAPTGPSPVPGAGQGSWHEPRGSSPQPLVVGSIGRGNSGTGGALAAGRMQQSALKAFGSFRTFHVGSVAGPAATAQCGLAWHSSELKTLHA